MQVLSEPSTNPSVSELASPLWPAIEPPLDWVEAMRWELGQQDVPYTQLTERNVHLAERNRYLRSVGLPQRFFSVLSLDRVVPQDIEPVRGEESVIPQPLNLP